MFVKWLKQILIHLRTKVAEISSSVEQKPAQVQRRKSIKTTDYDRPHIVNGRIFHIEYVKIRSNVRIFHK